MAERLSLEERLTKYTMLDPETGCFLWLGYCNRDGYGEIKVDGVKHKVHRIAYALYVAELEPGMVLDHLCRKRGCWRPDHLEQVTVRENTRRGDAAILTPVAVIDIRTRLADGDMPTVLAAQYGVSATTIWQVGRGARWSDISFCPQRA